MAEQIRIGPAQALRLEKAVARLETAGPLARPHCVARVVRDVAAHFYVLRRPTVIDELRAATSEVERDSVVAALVTSGSMAWFNVMAVVRQEDAAVRLYAVREDGRHRDLVEVEPESASPESASPPPRRPGRRRRSA